MAKVLLTIEELSAYADEFAANLTPQKGAIVVALSGELGAGKTAFTKELAKVFGIAETVTSPTFVIEKIYPIPSHAFLKQLIHIDAYRLLKDRELEALGFKQLLEDPSNLIVLEWPEKVSTLIPEKANLISFTVGTDGARHITHTLYGQK